MAGVIQGLDKCLVSLLLICFSGLCLSTISNFMLALTLFMIKFEVMFNVKKTKQLIY